MEEFKPEMDDSAQNMAAQNRMAGMPKKGMIYRQVTRSTDIKIEGTQSVGRIAALSTAIYKITFSTYLSDTLSSVA